MIKYILALMTLFSFSGLHSGFYTGKELYDLCKKEDKVCGGYVAGSIDSRLESYNKVQIDKILMLESEPSEIRNKVHQLNFQLCLPDGIALGQVIELFLSFVDKYPQLKEFDAHMIIQSALIQAYPCKN